MPAAAVMDLSDWADDSPVVDCSRWRSTPRTSPRGRSLRSSSSTAARRLSATSACSSAQYPAPDFPLQGRLFLPTPEQVNNGQKWVRCDIALAADTQRTRAAEITGSIEGALGTDPAAYWLCLKDVPKPKQNQPYTSCLKPHRTEVTPSDALLTGLDAYPSKATLAKEGRSYCDHFLAGRPDGDKLSAAPVWAAKDEWDGQTLRGGCWFWRKDGASLPPMG
jgi:hypothetical protein